MKVKGTRQLYYQDVANREITRDERLCIITLRAEAGWSWPNIEDALELSQSTCKSVYYRFKVIGTPSNRTRVSRPLLFNLETKYQIERFLISGPCTWQLTWDEIAEEMGLQCSGRTVQRAIDDLGYHKRTARRK